MTSEQIKEIQSRIGAVPDGIFGPISRATLKHYLKGLMPRPRPWPMPDDLSMATFYGPPGENLTRIDVGHLPVRYAGHPVSTIQCHELVAESLLRVLERIADGPCAEVLGKYAGCYNFRRKRNGRGLSKHAWGVAIDLDPGPNGLRATWPDRAAMPLLVMEAFAREGWTSAGAFWGYDAMHFEATDPR